MNVSFTEREKIRIEGNIEDVRAHIPEAADFIKSLHALGMVKGWRCVVWAGPIGKEPPATGVTISGPFKTGREFSECGRKDKRR